MPTYLYKCRKCEREFQVEQRITEDALTECILEDENGNKCGGEVFRKISRNVGLIFNGSGFYLTDYANKKGSTASNGTNGHNGNSSSKKNGSTEKTETKAKTETKSPAKSEA